jgi:hypothetical protein
MRFEAILMKPISKTYGKNYIKKITIVYSHNEETEYLKYIKFLQFKGILEPTIEQFDVEELQGVSGLKAIRIKFLTSLTLIAIIRAIPIRNYLTGGLKPN